MKIQQAKLILEASTQTKCCWNTLLLSAGGEFPPLQWNIAKNILYKSTGAEREAVHLERMINWCVTSRNTSWVKHFHSLLHPGSTSAKGESRGWFEVLLDKEFWFAQGHLSAVSSQKLFMTVSLQVPPRLSLEFPGVMDSPRSTTSKTQEKLRKVLLQEVCQSEILESSYKDSERSQVLLLQKK